MSLYTIFQIMASDRMLYGRSKPFLPIAFIVLSLPVDLPLRGLFRNWDHRTLGNIDYFENSSF
jgi:hypothetical protein